MFGNRQKIDAAKHRNDVASILVGVNSACYRNGNPRPRQGSLLQKNSCDQGIKS